MYNPAPKKSPGIGFWGLGLVLGSSAGQFCVKIYVQYITCTFSNFNNIVTPDCYPNYGRSEVSEN